MTDKQFETEKLYQISKSIAFSLFRNDIITEDEYSKIDTILLEKYAPVLGSLFSENDLIFCEI